MDLELERQQAELRAPAPKTVILVDTNAVGQFLVEIGRIRLRTGSAVRDLAADDRWLVDTPSSFDWFERALDLPWTHDPFDRLLVAHAALRGWRLATGDGDLFGRLGPGGSVEL